MDRYRAPIVGAQGILSLGYCHEPFRSTVQIREADIRPADYHHLRCFEMVEVVGIEPTTISV